MEASLKRSSFACYHKLYSQLIRREEISECVVPDTMADIASVVSTGGTPLIRSKDVSEGRVRLELNIPARVAYLPEGETGICCLDVNIPVHLSVEDARIREGSICTVGATLKALDTRVPNPRKLSVSAVLELQLDCYGAGETEQTAEPEDANCGIHVRCRQEEITAIAAVTEKTFVLTDELTLEEGKLPAAEILLQQVTLAVEEARPVGTRVILKGSAHSTVFYRTQDMAVDAAGFTTAFNQIVELDTDAENGFIIPQLLLSGMYYEAAPGFDGRSLRMELHAVAQVTLCRNETVQCLTDAYSNRYALELQQSQRPLQCVRRELTLRESSRETVETARPLREILHCCARVHSVEVQGGDVTLVLLVRLFARDEDGAAAVTKRLVTLQLHGDIQPQERLRVCGETVPELTAVPSGAGAELRLTAELRALVLLEQELNCITGIRYDEGRLLDLSDQPSLVMLRATERDDLWRLAREYHSTVEAINDCNDLTTAEGAWEKLLLIPRCV